jgi:uncharacterized alpha-E superfamily protein
VITGDDVAFKNRYDAITKENVVEFLTFDEQNPNSILSCLRAARENARGVREIISAEMWEHINMFYLMVKGGGTLDDVLDNPHAFFERVNVSGQQFWGVTDVTMTHGEAWHFCRLGRMLERADKTSRLLDVKYFILLPKVSDVGTPFDDIQWLALLRSASALEMYRQRHGRISPGNVVDFLILDREFPRAVLHCLTNANESLHAISGTPAGGFCNPAERRLGQLRAELAYTQADDVIAGGMHEFVDRLQTRLNQIGESIYDCFFAMRPLEAVGAGR